MYMYVQKHMAIDNKDRTGISCLHVFLRELEFATRDFNALLLCIGMFFIRLTQCIYMHQCWNYTMYHTCI